MGNTRKRFPIKSIIQHSPQTSQKAYALGRTNGVPKIKIKFEKIYVGGSKSLGHHVNLALIAFAIVANTKKFLCLTAMTS
jgi:hypothetical protein